MKKNHGFSLVELLTVLAIFGIVMAGLYSASTAQLGEGIKEYRLAESEMEHGIAKNIIERDLSMAGYGIMDDYDFDGDGVQNFTPTPRSVAVKNSSGTPDATPDADPDILILTGTALGLASRAAHGWSPVQSVAAQVPTFVSFNDAREDIRTNDRVVVMDPNTRRLVGDGSDWVFIYSATTTTPKAEKLVRLSDNMEFAGSFVGMITYGISSQGTLSDFGQPYYAVGYHLGGTPPSLCAPGTQNLLRAESKIDPSPSSGGSPILNCVLDFQVALGLDIDENGTIDLWDNAGGTAQGYSSKDLNKRLKQVRAYALVQVGSRDSSYTYSNPDPAYAATPDKIRVGDLYLTGGAVGRDVQLTAEQRKYRWRVLSVAVVPRNAR